MCGIVGYVGHRDAIDVLIPGLEQLEERGYDSAGLAVANGHGMKAIKLVPEHSASPSRELLEHPDIGGFRGSTLGLAHTRWATHGAVTVPNAHPHTDTRQRIWIAHNGIIENEAELREALRRQGERIRSETDSELIAHLIGRVLDVSPELTLEEAVRGAVRQLEGTWGLVVASDDHPDQLVVARNGSPLLVGKGDGEMFVASLEDAFLKFTRRMIVLEDGDVLTVRADSVHGGEHDTVELAAEDVFEEDAIECEHTMRKEIHAQPRAILNALNHGGRLLFGRGTAKLGGLDTRPDELLAMRHLRTVACGTARYASDYGVQLLEQYGGFQTVQSLAASEARPECFPRDTGVLAVSQSGETMDTLDVLQRAREEGHTLFSIVNRVGKAIARETGLGVYTNSGAEKAVASTKVFTAQAVVFVLMTLWFGRQRRAVSKDDGRRVVRELMALPDRVADILAREDQVVELARVVDGSDHVYYIGRGLAAPIAAEGALKITEVAYLHAQALAAGELKHGPIALLEPGFPVVALVPNDDTRGDMISALKEVSARGARTIVVAEQGARVPEDCAGALFRVPSTHPWLAPLLCAVPLQLLAYHVARIRGINPDRPRNLAKSVTVK